MLSGISSNGEDKGVDMFEKEAEKRTEEKYVCNEKEIIPLEAIGYKKGFKDGAEFGYNKAFVEADKNLKAVVADFNKANEWHYVKDGKYPKEKQLVMVYRVNPLGANIAITNWYDSYKDTKVIAWKEIVLPNAKED